LIESRAGAVSFFGFRGVDWPRGGSRMPESIVDVDLADLKRLIDELIDLEVDSRCHITAGFRLQDPIARSKLADEHGEAKAQQEKLVRLRYRELLNALESGKDIRSELSKFARQEGWHKKNVEAK
jgi:hypothetical protein